MPRYYLHLFNDVDVPDEEGRELRDLDAATTAACSAGRELIAEHVMAGTTINLSHRIDVAAASGQVLASVRYRDLLRVVDR